MVFVLELIVCRNGLGYSAGPVVRGVCQLLCVVSSTLLLWLDSLKRQLSEYKVFSG